MNLEGFSKSKIIQYLIVNRIDAESSGTFFNEPPVRNPSQAVEQEELSL